MYAYDIFSLRRETTAADKFHLPIMYRYYYTKTFIIIMVVISVFSNKTEC